MLPEHKETCPTQTRGVGVGQRRLPGRGNTGAESSSMSRGSKEDAGHSWLKPKIRVLFFTALEVCGLVCRGRVWRQAKEGRQRCVEGQGGAPSCEDGCTVHEGAA